MRTKILRAVVLLGVAWCATGASAQQPTNWELNAPYRCPDGTSYTFTKRTGTGYFSMCYYTVEHNGRLVTKAVTACRQMSGYLRGCTVGKATQAQPPSAPPGSRGLEDTQYSCAPGLTVAVFACQNRQGQSSCITQLRMNGQDITPPPMSESQIRQKVRTCKELPQLSPPYALEFPSVTTVINAMRAGNPPDTVRRSIGAFYQLGEIVKVLAGSRASTGYLPDEKKLVDQYQQAESTLETTAPKKFPGQQFSLATNPYHYGPMDPRFGFEGIPVWISFFTPGLHARYARLVGGNDPAYMAKVDQEWQAGLQEAQAKVMRAAQKLEAQSHSSSPYAGNDEGGRVELRRCMEAGRSEMECLGEGMKAGLSDLGGGDMVKMIAPKGQAGLRMTGVYSSGNLQIIFDATTAKVVCGNLIPQPLPYTVKRTGLQLLVGIPISPEPLTLSYRADGQLTGPGTIPVAGRIVTGTKTTTSTEYESQRRMRTSTGKVIDPDKFDAARASGAYGNDTNDTWTATVPVQKTHTIVLTAPKTETCSAAVLPPKGATLTVSGVLTHVLGTQASESQNSAPGLRLSGTYASPGGLKIEFRGDSATLECSDSEHSEGYAVVPQGGQLVVKFQNNTGPLALTLEPNGTLAGSGTVEVTGRVMTGLRGTQPIYVPSNTRCAVGTLTPGR